MFQPFVAQAAFHDFRIAENVVVAAADNTDDRFSAQPVRREIERGNRQRARRFSDNAFILIQFNHRGADFSFRDSQHFRAVAAKNVERHFSDAPDRRAVHKCVNIVQRDDAVGFQRFVHARRARRFNADIMRVRIFLLEINHAAGRQAAAADRRNHEIHAAFEFFVNLFADRALPGNHGLVIKRMNERAAVLPHEFFRFRIRIVERFADENDFNIAVAERADFLDFLLRRDGGHENRALNLQRGAAIRHALRMIARARADDAMRALFVGQRRNFVVRSANFEGSDFLQIFALQINGGLILLGKPFRKF